MFDKNLKNRFPKRFSEGFVKNCHHRPFPFVLTAFFFSFSSYLIMVIFHFCFRFLFFYFFVSMIPTEKFPVTTNDEDVPLPTADIIFIIHVECITVT